MNRPPAVWERIEPPAQAVADLVRGGIVAPLASLLAGRGFTEATRARRFLEPSLDQLRSAATLGGVMRAAERLAAAANAGEKVAVVGDYDADGVAATALLAATLRSVGLETLTILPVRHEEGYGFQPMHARRAHEAGCSLLLTVDCGVSGFDGAAEAARLGLDVIITDHHLPDAELPPALAVINPKIDAGDPALSELTGAGIAFKLAVAVLERLGQEVPTAALLRIACLGTIADVAPLVGENRIIAALGLQALARPRSPGLRALVERSGVRAPLRAADVGFRLGPRLNAAGRLGLADDALDLLLERDPARARELADRLERANTERQEHESRILDDARRQIRARGPLPPVIAIWSTDWHRGVVGVAAGRLAREFHRPVLLFAEEGGVAVGSGRSVEGISLHGFLSPWVDRFERFGGHDAAVGLSVESARLPALREEWERAAALWPKERLVPRLRYELELSPDELDEDLWRLISALEPFGAGNPEPLIRLGPFRTSSGTRRFGNGHVSVRVPASTGELEIVGWGWADRGPDWNREFEALGHLDRDRRSGRPTLRLVDARATRPRGAH